LNIDLAHARKLSREDPLLRAIGKGAVVVVDATAGLGRDAASLARLGISVMAIERNEHVAAAWRASMKRAPHTLSFIEGDARVVLASLHACGAVPDAVLIDPMYPDSDARTAAAQKELVELRAIVGDDADAADLLAVARDVCPRVVVKRPKRAKELAPGVAHSWAGASTRLDLYLR
jgi:16S rRNA (guanine1516-N2)-methyltransferase